MVLQNLYLETMLILNFCLHFGEKRIYFTFATKKKKKTTTKKKNNNKKTKQNKNTFIRKIP